MFVCFLLVYEEVFVCLCVFSWYLKKYLCVFFWHLKKYLCVCVFLLAFEEVFVCLCSSLVCVQLGQLADGWAPGERMFFWRGREASLRVN